MGTINQTRDLELEEEILSDESKVYNLIFRYEGLALSAQDLDEAQEAIEKIQAILEKYCD